MKGFNRNDSSELGFAVACLFHGAITLNEFHRWVESVLVMSSEVSPLLVDLLDFNGPMTRIFKVIGFVPDWPFPIEAKAALLAIAYQRGTPPEDCKISSTEAEEIRNRFPQVETRFKEMFPFANIC
ncbi:MAG: hypothetical protein KA419_15865 [Acidobacteria bacterium]|nr:hypothetical protein [Acidobacteriota bacterium]